jgi:acyl carrier protein
MAVYNETSTTPGIQEVAEQIKELLLKKVAVRVESADADIVGGGVLDSLALVRLVSALEERFGIDSASILLDIDSYRSINAIAAAIVERSMDGRGTPPEPDAGEERRATAGGTNGGERRSYVDEITALLLDRLSVHVESPSADLFRTGALDSMSLVRFILALEDHFGVQIPIDDLDVAAFRSIEDVAGTVMRYTGGRGVRAFGDGE